MSSGPISYLGVDGGGTKTALCVISSDGRRLAEHEAPSCYYLGSTDAGGVGLVRDVLSSGVAQVCTAADIDPADLGGAFFGLPAYGEVSADVPALDALPAEILGHRRYSCGNDMVCGWAGSLALAAGINVVSGTGSICYGENGHDRVRVGGWGELIGDEGSAYWLGLRGLQTWSQMADGRVAVGPLYRLLGDRLGLQSPLDLIGLVHEDWQRDRGTIASLAPLVVAAAESGDRVAETLVEAAVTELIRLVHVAAGRLDFGTGAVVPVSCSGGVFRSALIRTVFADQLTRPGPPHGAGFELRRPRFSPVIGAALYAAREAGQPLGPPALARLERSS